MGIKQEAYRMCAETIIKNLKKRGMDGCYLATGKEAVEAVLKELGESKTVTWGGSETIKECGLLDALTQTSHQLLDRAEAKTPEEKREFYGKAVMADVFLTSTNAISLDGQLINIDGNGNRVACLITGPKKVYVIAGMNKVVTNVEEGVNRTRNMAAPPNAVRLHTDTPCEHTGVCGDCYSAGCMCSEIVITRMSREKGRIKVFLVGEELGY